MRRSAGFLFGRPGSGETPAVTPTSSPRSGKQKGSPSVFEARKIGSHFLTQESVHLRSLAHKSLSDRSRARHCARRNVETAPETRRSGRAITAPRFPRMTRCAEKSSERGGIGGENSSEWKIDRRSVYVLWFSLLAGGEQRKEGVTPSRPMTDEKRRCDPDPSRSDGSATVGCD